MDRLAADDCFPGQTGGDWKALSLRYKTAALLVIQGVNDVAGGVFGDEDDAGAPEGEHARQLENGRPKYLVEIEGGVDERRELGDDLEPRDGDTSAPLFLDARRGAEARRHRRRNRSMTAPMCSSSTSSARRATVTPALVAAPLRSCHSLPNDSRRSA